MGLRGSWKKELGRERVSWWNLIRPIPLLWFEVKCSPKAKIILHSQVMKLWKPDIRTGQDISQKMIYALLHKTCLIKKKVSRLNINIYKQETIWTSVFVPKSWKEKEFFPSTSPQMHEKHVFFSKKELCKERWSDSQRQNQEQVGTQCNYGEHMLNGDRLLSFIIWNQWHLQ